MNSSLSVIAIISFVIISFSSQAQKGERKYEFTPEKSTITWIGNKGEEIFTGKMKLKSGYLTFKNEDLSQTVLFADVSSINCKSCGDAETARKILEFIRSGEFLNVQSMDFAVFKMYKSSILENSTDGNYMIEGNLTIIGYSNTIKIPITITEKKNGVFVEGKLSINRALWNLNDPKDHEITEHIEQTIELIIKLEGKIK